MTAPMTAAEARKLVVWPYGTSERILAALEEREALLGERETDAPFTAVGRGLVDSSCVGAEWNRLLVAARAAWDSLLPKEPEVVTGPSSQSYRVKEGRVEVQFPRFTEWRSTRGIYIPVEDAPVVAKLMGSSGEAGK